uniref:Uncharacterized protein n=1 Tax=Astyanax mexicanus TaxID=7994 RepID=A0A8B9HAI2_ASTMX
PINSITFSHMLSGNSNGRLYDNFPSRCLTHLFYSLIIPPIYRPSMPSPIYLSLHPSIYPFLFSFSSCHANVPTSPRPSSSLIHTSCSRPISYRRAAGRTSQQDHQSSLTHTHTHTHTSMFVFIQYQDVLHNIICFPKVLGHHLI